MPREQPQPLWGTSSKPGLYVSGKAARHKFHRLLVSHVAYCCRADDSHCSKAGLLCLESSHNRCGGTVLSLDYMSRVKKWADDLGIPVHLDGARVFNAAEALGVSVREVASHVTSIQFCLSKVRHVASYAFSLFIFGITSVGGCFCGTSMQIYQRCNQTELCPLS